MNWSWILPESASTYAPAIDRMYYVILFITGAVFLITEATLLWFLIKYRHREGRKAEYIHGNVTAEVIWTAVPFVIVVGIALASRGAWASIKASRHERNFSRAANAASCHSGSAGARSRAPRTALASTFSVSPAVKG